MDSHLISSSPSRRILPFLLAPLFLAATSTAQWDPNNGRWGKRNPSHLRVMTWNIQDNIRSGESKVEGNTSWHAIVTIVASLKPDILLLQEAGDNGSVDSVTNLNTVIDLFFHGGTDPFLGGDVTSYVT